MSKLRNILILFGLVLLTMSSCKKEPILTDLELDALESKMDLVEEDSIFIDIDGDFENQDEDSRPGDGDHVEDGDLISNDDDDEGSDDDGDLINDDDEEDIEDQDDDLINDDDEEDIEDQDDDLINDDDEEDIEDQDEVEIVDEGRDDGKRNLLQNHDNKKK